MRWKLGALGDDTTSTDSSSTDTSGGGGTPSWLTSITQGVLSAENVVNAQRITDLNIQRAAAGLPQINPAIVSPSVNVGLSAGTQQVLIYGGLGLAALWVASMIFGRR